MTRNAGTQRPAWLGVGVSVVALLAVTAVATTVDTAGPAPRTVALQAAALRACPMLPATPVTLHALAGDGQVQVARLDGGDDVGASQPGADVTTLDSPVVLPGLTLGVTVTAADQASVVTGGVHAAGNGQSWWGACQAPRAVAYVQFVSGSSATLMLANPDIGEASVDIGLSDPNGEVVAEGLRDLRVPARSTLEVPLNTMAAASSPLGVRVHAVTGRVVATGRTQADNGSDFAAATALGRNLLAVAVPAGAAETTLIVSNPATTRTKVRVEVLGAGGSVVPVDADALAVEAGRTTRFDLTTAVGGEAAAVRVSGPDEVGVTVFSRVGNDVGYLPASSIGGAPTLTLATPIAGPGILSLTNAQDEAAGVSVTWGGGAPAVQASLPAQSTQTIPVPDGATSVVVTADRQVMGAVALISGPEDGLAVAQLQPADAPVATVSLTVDPRTGR